jgi:hypothetical protein
MTLNRELAPAIYKSFKRLRLIFLALRHWLLLSLLIGFRGNEQNVAQTLKQSYWQASLSWKIALQLRL